MLGYPAPTPKSLLEQLPEIVAEGRKEASRILEGLENRHRVTLQTREWVLPAKDSVAQDWITREAQAAQREAIFNAGQGELLPSAQPLLGEAASVRSDEVEGWRNGPYTATTCSRWARCWQATKPHRRCAARWI